MKNNGLGKKDIKKDREDIIYILTILLFKYNSNMTYVENTMKELRKSYPNFENFFDYYENNWYYYLKNSMLDYSKISKLQRCNSYIENYNKIIKGIIGNTSKLNWPKFISFLKEQESTYTHKIIDMEKTTCLAGAKIYEILRHISYDQPYNNLDAQSNNNPFNQVKIKRNFFIWKLNSCRMDSSFFIFFFIIYGYCSQKEFKKNTYGALIYNMCKIINKYKESDFLKGIWPFIDNQESQLKKYITINKGLYETVYGLFKPFCEDNLFCPILEVYDSCICSINKEIIIKKEFGFPMLSVKEEDLDNKNNYVSLVSIFAETYKSNLIFCKACNTHPYEYYTKEQFIKTGEDAVYAHHMVKDIILPKFLIFILEGNINKDGCYISGYKSSSILLPEILIRGFK